MLSASPRALDDPLTSVAPDEPVAIDAPIDLVARYLQLTAQRRALEDQIAFVRSELEMLAVAALSEARPRGRLMAGSGVIAARLVPTCAFDRAEVATQLQRAGRLNDVATVTGPALARFLAKEPILAAKLGPLVRHRKSVMLTTA